MEFIQIEIDCPEQVKELLIATLLQQNFDGFEETEEGLRAFIAAQTFDRMVLEQSLKQFDLEGYRESKLPEQNWNAQWEANFDPIEVDDLCYIRASFHPAKPEIPHDIVIDPKMAFGTGHHQTTRLMIKALLQQSVEGKTVLDAGCGTGVLSILGDKLGAEAILAYDIDQWAVNNTHENITRNDCNRITRHHYAYRSIEFISNYSGQYQSKRIAGRNTSVCGVFRMWRPVNSKWFLYRRCNKNR